MENGSRSRRVSHPILRLEVLASDGTRSSSHRVFCRLRAESVPVGVCCACIRCDAIGTEPAPSVECSLPVPDVEAPRDLDGEQTEVGKVLAVGTLVLTEHCALREALGVLQADDRRMVGIVDASRVLIGVVREMAAIHDRCGTIGTAMTAPVTVRENTPIRDALRLLAATHSREATVVTSEGVPLGVFRDIDGMCWIARSRRGAPT
jgi:CBS domain-containing protein